MGAGPITFDYDSWVALFPNLSGVSEAQATLYFNNFSVLYVHNDGEGPINDPVMLTSLLNLTTAHIATLLSQQTNGIPTTGGTSGPSPLVGRISQATEGTVNVSTEMLDQQPNAAWWNTTIYGAAVWAAMKPYRTFRYMPPARRRVYNPPYYGRGGGYW